MRILVVTPYFYPHAGGSERYIEELYGAYLKAHPMDQVDVLTYDTEKVGKESDYGNLHIYRLPAGEILPDQFALPNYWSLWKLARKLKANHYDLVNAHTRFFDNAWWGWLLAKYLGAKSILTDHCADHPRHSHWAVRRLAEAVDNVVIPILGRAYDQVTVVSEATGKFLTAHGMGQKPMVIHGGVQVRPVRKVDHSVILVTFLGRMIPTKGPQLLLAAATKLTKKYPQVNFVFAGEGELLAGLKKSGSKKISFTGNLNRDQVNQLLAKTDIVVLPSTHHEGLPSVILEAGAAGCAVITTDMGGTGEIVTDGVTGLIIKPTVKDLSAKLSLLIEDEKLRKKLAVNLTQKVVLEFDWRGIAEKYREKICQMDYCLDTTCR